MGKTVVVITRVEERKGQFQPGYLAEHVTKSLVRGMVLSTYSRGDLRHLGQL